jgi:Flp pilus assembly protein TadD
MPRSLLSRFSLVACVALAAAVAGCQNFGDMTASLAGAPQMPGDDAGVRAYADHWGKVYAERPGEKYASINYAHALRALTRYKEATAVMQAAAVKAPHDYVVLGEYGKALADNGDLAQARDVLSRSYRPDRPVWQIMSVQGSVADRLDDHSGAQQFYNAALKIVPDEPSVLSNLGLSYALSKNLAQAEETLRFAAGQPRADARVRQNLALVLALEGKFREAEDASARDMSREDAASNVAGIRSMIAQNDSWRAIQAGASRRPPKAHAAASSHRQPG